MIQWAKHRLNLSVIVISLLVWLPVGFSYTIGGANDKSVQRCVTNKSPHFHKKNADIPIIKRRSNISRSSFLISSASVLMTLTLPPEASKAEPSNAPHVTCSISQQSSLVSAMQEATTLQESISGFIAGAALTTTKTFVKYPLDTATVRLQMPNTKYSIMDPLQLFRGSFNGITFWLR